MARIIFGSSSGIYDLSNHIPWNITPDMFSEQTTTSFKLVSTVDNFFEIFTGTGFKYDSAGFPIDGIISSFKHFNVNGQIVQEIYDWNGNVSLYFKSLISGDRYSFPGDLIIYLGDLGNGIGAGSGNDSIYGGSNRDEIHGYEGHDYLIGGLGADFLFGDSGNDHLYGQSAQGGEPDSGDHLFGGDGGDYLQGNAGNDTLDGGAGSDRINGGADNDSISGGSGNDTANGNRGSDTIDGGDGDDFLRGGQDDDLISGGAGNDQLSGDLGVDTLSGGAGADIFMLAGQGSTISAGPDRITDFADGIDHISIGYTPVIMLTAPVQSSLIAAGTTAQQLFDGHAGDHEAAALMVGDDTYIFYSSNGGTTADSAVLVSGISSIAFSVQDFI